jgi:hypothetical protein
MNDVFQIHGPFICGIVSWGIRIHCFLNRSFVENGPSETALKSINSLPDRLSNHMHFMQVVERRLRFDEALGSYINSMNG